MASRKDVMDQKLWAVIVTVYFFCKRNISEGSIYKETENNISDLFFNPRVIV